MGIPRHRWMDRVRVDLRSLRGVAQRCRESRRLESFGRRCKEPERHVKQKKKYIFKFIIIIEIALETT